MLRWIVGVGRKQQDQTQDSDTSSDGEEPEPLDEDDMETRDHEGPVKLENWVDYVRRATGIAEEHLRNTRLEDWVAGQRRRKWTWAGHAARRLDSRWSNKILHCNSLPGHRPRGRPKTRWRDAVEHFVETHTEWAGSDWTALAQDDKAWKGLTDKFVQQCCTADS